MPSAKLLADVLASWDACDEFVRARRGLDPTISARMPGKASADVDQDKLARTIEGEVIPRLMLAHQRGTGTDIFKRKDTEPGTEDVAELVRLVLEHDEPVALSFLETIHNRGTPIETLYIDLLAPAARLLGEMWKADLCDFTDVTVGLSRLQHLLHQISPTFEDGELPPPVSDCSILLISCPGEQHTFAVMLLEEHLRRAGWHCCTATPKSQLEVAGLVRKANYDVLGISLSCSHLLGEARQSITAARRASRNKSLAIMAGGPVFNDNPELVSRLGADFTAVDGRQAVLQLRNVFDTKTTRIR